MFGHTSHLAVPFIGHGQVQLHVSRDKGAEATAKGQNTLQSARQSLMPFAATSPLAHSVHSDFPEK